jgi:putative MATE family efflux protein
MVKPTRGERNPERGPTRPWQHLAVPILRDDLERRIVRLAIPALGTLAVEPIYVLVDTAIVGRLGTPQLAGMAIASIVLLNLLALLTFLEYITPDIAYAVSAGRPDDARRLAMHGVWLSLVLGVPFAVLVGVLARPLCWLIGGRGEVLHHAVTYLSISAVGLPFILIAFLGHGVLRGYNDLRTPLKIVVVANVVNLVLELVTVYGFHWGVAGSAASTVVVQAGAAAWFLWVMRHLLLPVRPSWLAWRPLLVTGVHMAVRASAMYVVWDVTVVIAAHLDAPTLAANQVVTQLFMFLALVLDSLAVPLHSLVAGALGVGNVDEARRIGRISVRLSLWAAAGLGLLVVAATPWLPHVFSADAAVQSRATAAMLVLAVMQLPGAVAFALDGALIGAHDMAWLGRQAVRNIIAFLPLAVATVVWPRLGLAGLWGAQMCWMVARAAVNWRRWAHLSAEGFRGVPTDMPAVA